MQALVLTCLYLACKVEEAYMSAESLGAALQQSEAALLATELPLLQAHMRARMRSVCMLICGLYLSKYVGHIYMQASVQAIRRRLYELIYVHIRVYLYAVFFSF